MYEKRRQLYELDPKSNDLVTSRLKVDKIFWRAELVFVAKNWDDLLLGVKG